MFANASFIRLCLVMCIAPQALNKITPFHMRMRRYNEQTLSRLAKRPKAFNKRLHFVVAGSRYYFASIGTNMVRPAMMSCPLLVGQSFYNPPVPVCHRSERSVTVTKTWATRPARVVVLYQKARTLRLDWYRRPIPHDPNLSAHYPPLSSAELVVWVVLWLDYMVRYLLATSP